MKTTSHQFARQRLLVTIGLVALLAACGGGGPGGESSAPYTILPGQFTASQHTATLAQDGNVILVGGSRGQSTLSDAVDRFDPATQTLTRIGTLSVGRTNHRATRLADGRIMITGGLASMNDPRTVELIDERTGAVSQTGSISVPRREHAVLALPDGRVLVTGGDSSGERMPLGISDSAEIWEPSTGLFRRVSQRMSVGRSGHSMTLLPDGRVLIVGGYSAAAQYAFAEIFDLASESFTRLALTQPVRASHAAHADSLGRVLILGGETVAPDGAPLPVASVLRFNPATGTWQEMPSLAAPRTWAASVRTAAGHMLLFGGQAALPHYTSSVERYDAGAGGAKLAALDGERALHTATLLKDGRVLVAGGEASDGAYRSTLLLFHAD